MRSPVPTARPTDMGLLERRGHAQREAMNLSHLEGAGLTRVKMFRGFRKLSQAYPHRFRIQYQRCGRTKVGFAFSLQEKVFRNSHVQSLFMEYPDGERLTLGPSGVRSAPMEDWTIISHSDVWYPPAETKEAT